MTGDRSRKVSLESTRQGRTMAAVFVASAADRCAGLVPRPLAALALAFTLAGCAAPLVVAGGAAAGGAALALDARPAAEHASDVALATKIDAKLIASKKVQARWISIEVIEGVVYLTGFVPSRQQKQEAERIARSEPNVKDVKNELVVGKPPISRVASDSWITAKVKSALFADDLVPGWSVHVETVNGRVYLTGIVPSAKVAKRAQAVALSVDGVRAVVNLLKVRKEK